MSKAKRLLSILGAVLLPVMLILIVFSGQVQRGFGANALVANQKGYLPIIRNQNPPTPTATQVPTTTPVPGQGFTFIAWADTKTGTAALTALSKQARNLNPAFTLYPGDLEPAGFTTSGMNTWKKAIDGGTGNGIFDLTFPLRGNHDHSNTTGWQSYFNTSGVAGQIGASHFTALDNDLTYSFEYGNAFFIGVDTPGDASLITPAQIAYIDSGLAGAESRGLKHAFLFFHGPVYAVSSHTSCGTRTCATPASIKSLITVLNKHSIVSAVFNGHEHLQSYVHLDSSRVPEITHAFEEFITGSAGAELYSCSKTFRFDYCGAYAGLAAVSVAGNNFTVKIYKQGDTTAVKTYTFTK
jgi:hypothetical protein